VDGASGPGPVYVDSDLWLNSQVLVINRVCLQSRVPPSVGCIMISKILRGSLAESDQRLIPTTESHNSNLNNNERRRVSDICVFFCNGQSAHTALLHSKPIQVAIDGARSICRTVRSTTSGFPAAGPSTMVQARRQHSVSVR